MAEVLSSALMLIGAAFTLIAAIGVARMPDLFLRLHCSTKSATLGIGCLLLGAALHFGNGAVWARALAAVVFFYLTAPVAAHMIGRAAYFAGVPLWGGTLSDELRGHYDERTHALKSGPAALAGRERSGRPS
jgi:multicomponent Na+:H+ antiporter subunit G